MQSNELKKYLKNAAFDGFAASASTYPGGAKALAEAIHADTNKAMRNGLSQHNLLIMKVRERVELGVWLRLEHYQQQREGIRAMILWLMQPWNAPLLAKLAWQAADEVWHAAGDTATDFNYYSKRSLLVGVMSSSMIFWLQDDSPNFTASRAFLQRRINEVLKIGGSISKAKQMGEMAGKAAMPLWRMAKDKRQAG